MGDSLRQALRSKNNNWFPFTVLADCVVEKRFILVIKSYCLIFLLWWCIWFSHKWTAQDMWYIKHLIINLWMEFFMLIAIILLRCHHNYWSITDWRYFQVFISLKDKEELIHSIKIRFNKSYILSWKSQHKICFWLNSNIVNLTQLNIIVIMWGILRMLLKRGTKWKTEKYYDIYRLNIV